MHSTLIIIYEKLYNLYGPQGWWPLINYNGVNLNKTGAIRGYHPGNYNLPQDRGGVYEVILGAILTQNTSWKQAENALMNLYGLNAMDPSKLLSLSEETLKSAIRCAGFLNQKSMYLQEISKFFIELEGRFPERKNLINVKGIGNETADSILLYAYKKPEFVVDTYTRRIFSSLGLIGEDINYLELKNFFQSNLPSDFRVYNEYHALIVEHAKRYYNKKPYGIADPLIKINRTKEKI